MTTSDCEIPTTNLQPWLDKSDPDKFIADIRSASFESAKKFFLLPLEKKQSLAKDPVSGRGYEIIGSQALQAGHPNLKGAMRVGREVPPDDPKYGAFFYGPNHWPNIPEQEFKVPVMEYRAHLLKLAIEIMKILAKGLPYGDDVFNKYLEDPVASVKMLHYPPQPNIEVFEDAIIVVVYPKPQHPQHRTRPVPLSTFECVPSCIPVFDLAYSRELPVDSLLQTSTSPKSSGLCYAQAMSMFERQHPSL
ncbi:hypothetical protein G7Y89_g2477 [Cudoniella acicularis]|uniref:Non-haem dioxygenase N-terminal domain-containing protein n=1 Tax=Cudoniella acicularis TaxID=354080 RepID=A0A8H4W6X6_9HELO|nr:hypothetical protein G7Y89_g2477 [Cudoniella acicularis]